MWSAPRLYHASDSSILSSSELDIFEYSSSSERDIFEYSSSSERDTVEVCETGIVVIEVSTSQVS
jgi:hypothetical protein